MLSDQALKTVTIIVVIIVVIVIIAMIIAGMSRHRVKNDVKTDWCNEKTRAAEQDDGAGDKFFGYNLWRDSPSSSSSDSYNVRSENKQERIMVNSSKKNTETAKLIESGLENNPSELIEKINLQKNQSYVETLTSKKREKQEREDIEGPTLVAYDSFEFHNGHTLPPVKLFIQWVPVPNVLSYNIYCNDAAIVTKDNYKKRWTVLGGISYYETEELYDDHCWSIAVSAITSQGETQLSKVFTNCKV
jgi:hypothetical protein